MGTRVKHRLMKAGQVRVVIGRSSERARHADVVGERACPLSWWNNAHGTEYLEILVSPLVCWGLQRPRCVPSRALVHETRSCPQQRYCTEGSIKRGQRIHWKPQDTQFSRLLSSCTVFCNGASHAMRSSAMYPRNETTCEALNWRCGFGLVGDRGDVEDSFQIPSAASTGGKLLSCYNAVNT